MQGHCSHFAFLSDIMIRIYLLKSELIGVGVPFGQVNEATKSTGCAIMRLLFIYLGLKVGNNISKAISW